MDSISKDITISGNKIILTGTILETFKEFVKNQKDLPKEFQEIVDKGFWDLLA